MSAPIVYDRSARRLYRQERDQGATRHEAREKVVARLVFTCRTCGHRFTEPTPAGRCPLEVDHAEPAEPTLAEQFRAALAPLIAFRDAHLDIDGLGMDSVPSRLFDAADDLDRAFDYLDAAERWLADLDG